MQPASRVPFDLPRRRDTISLARRVGSILRPGHLVLLEGPLGAGKTFFVRALLRSLGVTERVTSPTFALVSEYECAAGRVLHADLYRVRDEASPDDAVRRLDLAEARRDAIVLVEWGEGLEAALGGAPALRVALAPKAEGGRTATLDGPLRSDLARTPLRTELA